MESIEKLLDKFVSHRIKQYEYTLNGNWRKNNVEAKKLAKIHKAIIAQGQDAQQKLLELIYDDRLEVALLAAVFSMRFNPEKCLTFLIELVKMNIPHISTSAKYAIKNWENGQWDID